MGAVHPTALRFFVERMNDHDGIESCILVSSEHDIFELRRFGHPSVLVHYSNAYLLGSAEYDLRPDQIRRGSFILLLPHADADPDVVERARLDGVGIGHLAKLMGALNFEHVSEYHAPDES